LSTEKVNHWLQISANAGIIVSLLLVGFQLKQNSDLLSTELLYEESKRVADLEVQFIGENGAEVWAKSLTDPENLTLAEQRIMEASLWTFVEGLRASRMLADRGLLDEEDWRQRVAIESEYYFGNSYGRSWWRVFASEDNTGLPADLLDAITEAVDAASPTNTYDYTRRTIGNLD
jgi:hypothetical protein